MRNVKSKGISVNNAIGKLLAKVKTIQETSLLVCHCILDSFIQCHTFKFVPLCIIFLWETKAR